MRWTLSLVILAAVTAAALASAGGAARGAGVAQPGATEHGPSGCWRRPSSTPTRY